MGYFEIGKVVGTHGIKGTFKVYPTTEDPSRFELLKEVIFDFRGNKEVFKIKNVAYHKNTKMQKYLYPMNLLFLLRKMNII